MGMHSTLEIVCWRLPTKHFLRQRQALLEAAQNFFTRYNQCPRSIVYVLGSRAANVLRLYSVFAQR